MTAAAMTMNAFEDDEGMQDSRLGRFSLGLAAVLTIVASGWAIFQITGERSVSQLQIEGRMQRLSVGDVEEVVRPLLGGTQFADVDLGAVHDAVVALSWVARASVERSWPSTVRIRLWERQPVAHWNQDQLLDERGEIFAPEQRELPPDLPRLSGPEGAAQTVEQTFARLEAPLASTPFALAGLTQDPRGDWTATTVDGIELRFGRRDPGEGVAVLKGPALRALGERLGQVRYIDLRYTNGFSVGWREPPTTRKGS